MTRVLLMVLVIVAALATPLAVEAQPPPKMVRIGWLGTSSSTTGAGSIYETAFMAGLRELGYVEDQSACWLEAKHAALHSQPLQSYAHLCILCPNSSLDRVVCLEHEDLRGWASSSRRRAASGQARGRPGLLPRCLGCHRRTLRG
jgi:hypothetical protein